MTYENLPNAIKAGVMQYADQNRGSIEDIDGVSEALTSTVLRFQGQVETQVTFRTLTPRDVSEYVRQFLNFARRRTPFIDVAAVDQAAEEACVLWPDCTMIKEWLRGSG